MKYFVIAGEASGDIHASQMIKALRKKDQNAEFRFFGGDFMESASGVALWYIIKIWHLWDLSK